jgi:hypothetical protein
MLQNSLDISLDKYGKQMNHDISAPENPVAKRNNEAKSDQNFHSKNLNNFF